MGKGDVRGGGRQTTIRWSHGSAPVARSADRVTSTTSLLSPFSVLLDPDTIMAMEWGGGGGTRNRYREAFRRPTVNGESSEVVEVTLSADRSTGAEPWDHLIVV